MLLGAVRRVVPLLVAVSVSAAFAAGADAAPPSWSNVKIQRISPFVPWTEPRIATGPDGTLWAVTNGEEASEEAGGGEENGAPALVFYSTDGGNTWHKTDADFAGQTQTTPDVDIVTLPNGRVVASELDTAGLNFPGAVTDDGGKSWKQSQGANMLVDQDRQWFAAGPDPETGKERVYLLYHNLGSGNINHNMFVARSDDGGETFGPPVPITLPGDAAYNDLQCADSGGPSTIFVNQADGTVYAEFTTRGTPVQGVGELGGCATPFAGQPLEFNIVAGTRIWFAQSKDGGQTWTKSLPVDNAATGEIVSMQIAYATIDSAGNIYVAYPESPKGRKYPDYAGAAVRYKWARPADDAADLEWSDPVTLAPDGESIPGHVLVHMAAGYPGQLMTAYWEGTPRDGKVPIWHMTSAETLDGLAPSPTIEHARISEVPADTGTASELMGACTDVPVIAGLINGLFCGRSPDVWGITVDNRCMTHLVWPAVDQSEGAAEDAEHVAPDSDPGTWISNQTGGPSVCDEAAARAAPEGGATAPTGPGAAAEARRRCPDRLAPVTRIRRRRTHLTRTRVVVRGRSRDRRCQSANTIKPPAKVKRVYISVARVRGKGHGRNCRFLKRSGRLGRYRDCRDPVLLRAHGTKRWSFSMHPRRLPLAGYRIVARAVDLYGNKEKPARRRNIALFRLR